MKSGIALRFGLVLALIGVLASGLTGYYAYSASRKLLVHAAEQQLLTATQVLGRRITVMFDGVAANARLLAGHPRAAAILAAGTERARAADEDDFATLFEQMLSVHPEYFQVRLIAAADFGAERVRVDRDDSGLLRVRGDDLQEKAHYPYVFETLRLQAGQVYISQPAINHEQGAHAGEGKPALQLAAPVFGDSGTALGLVVINVDLNSMFTLLAADLPSDFQLYLANPRGDFLIHPDPVQAFAFDRGQRAQVQDEFAATAALLDGRRAELVTTTPIEPHRAAVVAAFVRQLQPETSGLDSTFILGLAQPLRAVLRESDQLGDTILKIVFAFSALAIAVTPLLTRRLTRPLNAMVRAVEHFTADHTATPLPVDRRDEIGVLARSFAELQQQIAEQLAALRQNQLELDHLASHDSLTGLPNRRLFYDRLEQMLARSRRSGEPMALLYIDLDGFKEINDRYGHAAGDVVLRQVAECIRGAVREVDTVARLGGDEFVVLLEGTARVDSVATVAQKILDALVPPIAYDGLVLQTGASIGISVYPRDGTQGVEFIANADRAMYQAKHAGRNRFYFASTGPSSLK
jgi:diguanylate cyclase (GGDEF)-like protein